MPHRILAERTASVSDLKKNPMGTVAAGEGFDAYALDDDLDGDLHQSYVSEATTD
ncbi:hypothetical protein SAMN02927900_03575 [Rhizobium mongolense subsp. loessense]|uniref:Uncharacterized protein n=1 Tax=Rhizobium mongolense subsp. loessense TaxID=158890 RepID=A0A1G4SB59_9HYPH|nr:hypothetical protein [Rhizobium mongolense]SCW66296.1 hypothetical protein SAMN02927900_03575 [Rhizobium mongolense subsp. loessense]